MCHSVTNSHSPYRNIHIRVPVRESKIQDLLGFPLNGSGEIKGIKTQSMKNKLIKVMFAFIPDGHAVYT